MKSTEHRVYKQSLYFKWLQEKYSPSFLAPLNDTQGTEPAFMQHLPAYFAERQERLNPVFHAPLWDAPGSTEVEWFETQFNPYYDILVTEPTVFVGLEYKSIYDTQLLFQDAACTVPVEDIGDPIGGVKDLLTEDIVAVQTTDAQRPLWGGVGVGTIFNGVDQFLELSGNLMQLATTSSWSIYVDVIPDAGISGTNTYVSWLDESSSMTRGYRIGVLGDERIFASVGGSSFLGSEIDNPPLGTRVTAALTSDEVTFEAYNDTVLKGSASTGTSEGSSNNPPTIGVQRRGSDGNLLNQFSGSILSISQYNDKHDANKVVAISEALQ